MTAAHSPASPAAPAPPAGRPPLGLRERKKIRTREAIRAATYALVREQGYDATTIEQIAERAEVSPSTVCRYFPAKEDIVLTDAWDPLLARELRARPADEPWACSVRHALHTAIGRGVDDPDGEVSRLRTRLMAEVPAVRSRMMESMSVTGHLLRTAAAERTGRDPESLEVRAWAASLVGALMETTMFWAERGHRDDLADLVDRTLTVLEHGLPPENR
ncbi:TetR/AcrR family transcriptional regulator [Streptomyces sp. NRRL S-340]|uniref:TetR/AcrR family transcriptional regulator n=1 Tax=Streptomyces sp. NRRL S-340 TaxID=1463901 RepID=UPI00055E7355|nr:TetR family transcriptional regulator [Streptomyces sp. NRRL S-340]